MEPEALDIICSYPGSLDDLFRRIISSTDRSVAVIRTSEVSCLLDSANSDGRKTNDENTNDNARDMHAVSSQRHDFVPSLRPSVPVQSLTIPTPQDSYAELKCDITGRSTCVGDYDDFVCYFRDRYAKIREILSRRLNSRPIESLGKSTSGREVSLIGMVMEIRNTAKGNRVIELEDPTGMIVAVIQKDAEVYEQSSLIIPDEVIGVTGISDGNGRLFVKSLLWPDMPNQTAPLEKGSGYALLISDLHVGSKYFMDDAWQRFVAVAQRGGR